MLTTVDMPAYKMTCKKTSALPAGADDNNRFQVVFIPTYKRWVGMQANPWVIPDSTAIQVLQAMWDAIYVDAPYTVIAGDVVFEHVCVFVFLFLFLFLTTWLGHTTSLRMVQLLQMCG
jgi:hypothetical protein